MCLRRLLAEFLKVTLMCHIPLGRVVDQSQTCSGCKALVAPENANAVHD